MCTLSSSKNPLIRPVGHLLPLPGGEGTCWYRQLDQHCVQERGQPLLRRCTISDRSQVVTGEEPGIMIVGPANSQGVPVTERDFKESHVHRDRLQIQLLFAGEFIDTHGSAAILAGDAKKFDNHPQSEEQSTQAWASARVVCWSPALAAFHLPLKSNCVLFATSSPRSSVSESRTVRFQVPLVTGVSVSP